MTKLHFDDLTKITCPFGMLDDDTQQRLMDCEDRWLGINITVLWRDNITYRAKPKPKRVVTWVQWDSTWGAFEAETLDEAKRVQEDHGGYIYRIERDDDGSNPTIKLVDTGGKNE